MITESTGETRVLGTASKDSNLDYGLISSANKLHSPEVSPKFDGLRQGTIFSSKQSTHNIRASQTSLSSTSTARQLLSRR